MPKQQKQQQPVNVKKQKPFMPEKKKGMVLPVYKDVVAAAKRIKGIAHNTPVMTSRTLDKRMKAKVFIKCDNIQRMGAFKFRGSYNALATLTPAQKKRGVVAWSSGNHGQAISYAGQILGIPRTIFMPRDSPKMKQNAAREYGGNVVLFQRYVENPVELAEQQVKENGMTFITPFNTKNVLAGAGTAAKELIDEVGELDYLFVPIGGGGLVAGSAIAAEALSPGCKVIGVEPKEGNDAYLSLRQGKIVTIKPPKTIADGAATLAPGEMAFAIIKEKVADIELVTDDQLIESMKFLGERMKIIVEPTGCLGFSGLQNSKINLKGKRIGVILSGGNIDLERYSKFISQ